VSFRNADGRDPFRNYDQWLTTPPDEYDYCQGCDDSRCEIDEWQRVLDWYSQHAACITVDENEKRWTATFYGTKVVNGDTVVKANGISRADALRALYNEAV
jgi:hypothetical protein